VFVIMQDQFIQILISVNIINRPSGDAVDGGNLLQAGWSPVQFPRRSQDF
jgi:hypothetical protein